MEFEDYNVVKTRKKQEFDKGAGFDMINADNKLIANQLTRFSRQFELAGVFYPEFTRQRLRANVRRSELMSDR